jgi:glycosyltransferase involved in cell wall biosynthesis
MSNKIIKNLSVVLAIRNESKKIYSCLNAVYCYTDDLVVVDGKSSDNSVSIVQKFGARLIETNHETLFHINKQIALDAAKHEWVLQLDADEIVTEELMSEVQSSITTQSFDGFYIPRKNYFLGEWLRKGGQYPDYVIRLVKKDRAHFPCKSVHEQIDINGKVGYLNEALLHYSFLSLEEYFIKMDRYTNLEADKLRKVVKNNLFRLFVSHMIINPITSFFARIIRHKAILDGWRGILYALLSAMHYPVIFIKACYAK